MGGFVWLVGAGPGDAGLLTLRGREVLARADVVIYDRLVGAGVLALAPERALKINVGKRSGAHLIEQGNINKILLEQARADKRVVRLKGGDSFLFGRGGEEAEFLLANKINFEVIAGVSSSIAVPEAAGIPVTHRDAASGLEIITAHDKRGGLPELNKFAGTRVFLMGASSAPSLAKELMALGESFDTPVAVVERGTTARQRRLDASLGRLIN